jgi:hypothetical protein
MAAKKPHAVDNRTAVMHHAGRIVGANARKSFGLVVQAITRRFFRRNNEFGAVRRAGKGRSFWWRSPTTLGTTANLNERATVNLTAH